jgi:hypothetical protein
MANTPADNVGDTTSTVGTADFVIDGVALQECVSFATALTNGVTYGYHCVTTDKTSWETGSGVWTSATSTLSRVSVSRSSNGGAKVSFAAGAKSIGIVVQAADFASAATDANISMSDITTNNVSATKHGFTPKAPADATKVLLGDGTWGAVPGGGGATLGANTFTAAQEIDIATTAATSADGLNLFSTTAATSGNQQFSPRVHWKGFGWKTTATAASQAVEFIAEVQPVQGAANPSGKLVFSYAINGGSYTIGPSFGTDGTFFTTVNSVLSIGIAVSGQTTVGIGRDGSVGGLDLYGDTTPAVNIGANHMTLKSTSVVGFTASSVTQTIDAGITRSASTLVAVVKSNSQSDFGDLKLRGLIHGTAYTVSTLPTASTVDGGVFYVSDLTSLTNGSTPTGSGALKGLVKSNGTAYVTLG